MLSKRDVQESLVGSVVACTAVMISLGVATAAHLAWSGFSIVAVTIVLFSIVFIYVATKGAARIAASTAIASICTLVPIFLFGCSLSLSEPLVVLYEFATPDISAPLVVLVIGFVGAALAFPLSLLARLLARWALVPAVALFVAGLFVFVLGVRSLGRPAPDAFLRTFDEVRVEPGRSAHLGDVALDYWHTEGCKLEVTHGHVGDEVVIAGTDICPPVIAYRNAKTGIIVVETTSHEPITVIGAGASYAPELGIADLRGQLGAPRAWVFAAGTGLLVGLGALVFAFRARRRERDAAAGEEARHVGGGWVTVDGAPRYVADLATRCPGPVVIVSRERTRPMTYRDDGAAKIFTVIDQSRANAVAEAHARTAAWALVAIASVATSSAPLWVAATFGIL